MAKLFYQSSTNNLVALKLKETGGVLLGREQNQKSVANETVEVVAFTVVKKCGAIFFRCSYECLILLRMGCFTFYPTPIITAFWLRDCVVWICCFAHPRTVFLWSSHSSRYWNMLRRECAVQWTPSTEGDSCFTRTATFADYYLSYKMEHTLFSHIVHQVEKLFRANFGQNRVISRAFREAWPSRSVKSLWFVMISERLCLWRSNYTWIEPLHSVLLECLEMQVNTLIECAFNT